MGTQLPPGALSYNQVFASPWADSAELENRHAQLVSQIGFWPIDHTDPEMPVDYAKLFLLCNIFLFNTEKVTRLLELAWWWPVMAPRLVGKKWLKHKETVIRQKVSDCTPVYTLTHEGSCKEGQNVLGQLSKSVASASSFWYCEDKLCYWYQKCRGRLRIQLLEYWTSVQNRLCQLLAISSWLNYNMLLQNYYFWPGTFYLTKIAVASGEWLM